MLKFKDMDQEKSYNPLNSRAASQKRFSASQIKRANDFVKRYGSDETKKFLSKTSFGDDPKFVGAVLTAMKRAENVFGGTADSRQLNFPDMDYEQTRANFNDIRDYLEQEVYDARSTWIDQHGPITNDSHPLDDPIFGGDDK